MRVTQSMLSGNMLRNLNNSNSKMGKLQEQLSSGSRLTRPSDDPVATTKGINYRTTLTKNDQFTRNMNEVNSWLDTTDDALTQVNNSIKRVQELVTQAANGTNTDDDRKKMQTEIDQIRQHIRDVGNSQSGDKYIFSGTNTLTPLFADESANSGAGQTVAVGGTDGIQGNMNNVEIEVYNGVKLQVNTPGQKLFKDIDDMMSKVQQSLVADTTSGGVSIDGKTYTSSTKALTNVLGTVQNCSADVLKEQATIGAKQNRADLMADRLSTQKISVTKQKSNNEDVDYEQAITDLITEESIHRASLSVGGKIIQPTLVDFL